MNIKKYFQSVKKIFLTSVIFFAVFFSFSNISLADQKDWGHLPQGWSNQIDSQLKLTHKEGDGVEQVKSYLTGTFIPLVKFLMVGIAIVFLIVALFSIVFSMGAEAETESKKFGTNFGFAILGFVLISFSEKIANAVNPIVSNNNQNFGDIGQFESMANILVNFSAILIGGIAVAIIVISGIKIVQSRGEGVEDEFKKILSAGIGLIITLLSRKFIYEIFFTNYGMSGVNETASLSTTQEVMGVISFFMQYIAIGGVALIVLAGIYYIFSSGEGNDNTALAKGIMKNVSIGLIILMSSYSLVTIFLPV